MCSSRRALFPIFNLLPAEGLRVSDVTTHALQSEGSMADTSAFQTPLQVAAGFALRLVLPRKSSHTRLINFVRSLGWQ